MKEDESWDVFWSFHRTLYRLDKRFDRPLMTISVVSKFIRKWGKYEL